jgi:hypothetical protein
MATTTTQSTVNLDHLPGLVCTLVGNTKNGDCVFVVDNTNINTTSFMNTFVETFCPRRIATAAEVTRNDAHLGKAKDGKVHTYPVQVGMDTKKEIAARAAYCDAEIMKAYNAVPSVKTTRPVIVVKKAAYDSMRENKHTPNLFYLRGLLDRDDALKNDALNKDIIAHRLPSGSLPVIPGVSASDCKPTNKAFAAAGWYAIGTGDGVLCFTCNTSDSNLGNALRQQKLTADASGDAFIHRMKNMSVKTLHVQVKEVFDELVSRNAAVLPFKDPESGAISLVFGNFSKEPNPVDHYLPIIRVNSQPTQPDSSSSSSTTTTATLSATVPTAIAAAFNGTGGIKRQTKQGAKRPRKPEGNSTTDDGMRKNAQRVNEIATPDAATASTVAAAAASTAVAASNADVQMNGAADIRDAVAAMRPATAAKSNANTTAVATSVPLGSDPLECVRPSGVPSDPLACVRPPPGVRSDPLACVYPPDVPLARVAEKRPANPPAPRQPTLPSSTIPQTSTLRLRPAAAAAVQGDVVMTNRDMGSSSMIEDTMRKSTSAFMESVTAACKSANAATEVIDIVRQTMVAQSKVLMDLFVSSAQLVGTSTKAVECVFHKALSTTMTSACMAGRNDSSRQFLNAVLATVASSIKSLSIANPNTA